MTLRIAVAGASGRMGRMLIEAVESAPDCTLAGTLDIGRDIRVNLADAQVLIDFTRPEGTMAHLAACPMCQALVEALADSVLAEPAHAEASQSPLVPRQELRLHRVRQHQELDRRELARGRVGQLRVRELP